MLKRTVAIILAVLAIAGCAGNNAGASEQKSDKLAFTAKTIYGDDFDGKALAGKPSVLWFWAPWCPTCQMEASSIEASAQEHTSIQFVGVAARDDVSAMRGFVDKYKLTFPQLADIDAKIWGWFGVVSQPALALIDRQGRVELLNGLVDSRDLEAKLHALESAAR